MSRPRFSPRRGGTFRPQLEALDDRLAPGALSGAPEPPPDVAFLARLQAAEQQAATRTPSPVVEFDHRSVVRGESTLIRTDDGVGMHLTVSGVAPGAYSAWWVVVETPGATPKVGNATGGVVGPNGTATFAAHLNEGETLLGHPTLSGGSLQDARRAEIRLVLRFHGQPDPGRIYEQTHSFEPEVGVDALISIHLAP